MVTEVTVTEVMRTQVPVAEAAQAVAPNARPPAGGAGCDVRNRYRAEAAHGQVAGPGVRSGAPRLDADSAGAR